MGEFKEILINSRQYFGYVSYPFTYLSSFNPPFTLKSAWCFKHANLIMSTSSLKPQLKTHPKEIQSNLVCIECLMALLPVSLISPLWDPKLHSTLCLLQHIPFTYMLFFLFLLLRDLTLNVPSDCCISSVFPPCLHSLVYFLFFLTF